MIIILLTQCHALFSANFLKHTTGGNEALHKHYRQLLKQIKQQNCFSTRRFD
jgi:hypothetical protein